MNEMNHLVLKFQGDRTGSPQTLPSLSHTQSPNPQSLSPHCKVKNTFSGQIKKLPLITKLDHSKLNIRFLNSHKTELQPNKTVFNSFGKVKILAANTCSGTLNKKNEDRVRIILNIKRPILFTEEKWPKSSFFSIFDGHGGSLCAEYLKENLHDFIFTSKSFPYRIKKAIFKGFHSCEKRFLEVAEENNDFSGSCALISLIIGDKCIISNVGDSKAILSMNHGEKIVVVTTEHSPVNETERAKVLKSGGKMFCDYFIDESGFKVEKGKTKVNPGGLTVTRCLGSVHAKLKKFGGQPELFQPDPSIKTFTIRENYDFLLLASSGFFEQLSCQELVDLVWTGIINSTESNTEKKLDDGLKHLLTHALEVRCEENISIIIIGFQQLVNYCK